MKKTSIILAAVMAAGMVSATVVWQNDFNSANTFFNPAPNPVDMHNGRDDAWLGAGTVSINGSNQLNIKSAGSGQTRGLVRALTTNNVALVDTTGDDTFYRFSFDVVNIFGQTDFNVEFLKGIRDADGSNPETNTYGIDLLSPLNAELTHVNIGLGSLTSLSDTTYTRADTGTTVVIEFEYDGIGDLVMVFDTTGNNDQGWERWAVTDNWTLEVVPEPATLGLLGAAGAGLLLFRRRFAK
jgi:hypothetical protein